MIYAILWLDTIYCLQVGCPETKLMMLQVTPNAAASSPAQEQQQTTAYRKHRESVLNMLAMHDEWDHLCPFFMFKYTQDGATGAWNSSAKEAAVSYSWKRKNQKYVTTVLKPGPSHPPIPSSNIFSYIFFSFFSLWRKKRMKRIRE